MRFCTSTFSSEIATRNALEREISLREFRTSDLIFAIVEKAVSHT